MVVRRVTQWVAVEMLMHLGVIAADKLLPRYGHECCAGLLQKIKVVGNDNPANGQLLQNLDELFLIRWVQIIGGFVQEQCPGLHGQRGCQRDQPFFSAGKLVGEPPGQMWEPKGLKGFLGPCLCRLGLHTEIQRTKGHVFQNTCMKKLVFRVLQHQAHFFAECPELMFSCEWPVAKADLPGNWLQQPGYQKKKGAFAAAVRAVKAQALAFLKGKDSLGEYRFGLGICKGKLVEREKSHVTGRKSTGRRAGP